MESSKPAAVRAWLAVALIALCTPAMSESFLDKLKKAKDSIERGTADAKRTVDDVAELGSSGKRSKKGATNGAGESESTTVPTVNGGDTQLAAGPSAELRQQVVRMGNACRERRAEHEDFASCHSSCSEAEQKISSASNTAANDEAHASCLARYNQAMGIKAPGAGQGAAMETPPAKVEAGQSPMPGAG